MTTNPQRAQWAEQCLGLFVGLTGVDDMSDAVGDLVANLGHYCRSNGLDFLALLRTGIGHWAVEQIDPDHLGPMPRVTIRVDGCALGERATTTGKVVS